MRPASRACSSGDDLAEIRQLAGVPQAAHLRPRHAPARCHQLGSSQRASAPLRRRRRARARDLDDPASAPSDASNATTEPKFRSRLRHWIASTASNSCASTRSSVSSSNGAHSPVSPKCAVAREAPGAASDLRDLVGAQIAPLTAVELAPRRKRDVIDIHVEAHADRIGGDEKVHLAALIERDLGVARARAERAHHHRRAAAMPAQQFGDRVNFFRRERDHRRALRQLGDLRGPA